LAGGFYRKLQNLTFFGTKKRRFRAFFTNHPGIARLITLVSLRGADGETG